MPKPFRRFLIYALVGLIGFGLDFFLFVGATLIGVAPVSANIFAVSLAAVTTYILHGRITFQVPPTVKRFLLYFGISLSGLVAGTYMLLFFISMGLSPLAAKLLSMAIIGLVQFVLSSWTVYRNGADAGLGDTLMT